MPPLRERHQQRDQKSNHGQEPPGINGPGALWGGARNDAPPEPTAQQTKGQGHIEDHPPVKQLNEVAAKASKDQSKGDGHVEQSDRSATLVRRKGAIQDGHGHGLQRATAQALQGPEGNERFYTPGKAAQYGAKGEH